MGLFKAAGGAIGGTFADQWLEFFYCDALPANVLAVKGQKRISNRSSNVRAEDNIISNGAGIAVADGQCMIIVEQGRILDVCAVPGQYTFNLGSEPSLFAGDGLGKMVKNTWERFKFGGSPGKDTRVYYINTKELIGNKYGTPNPVPFRVVDKNIGLDIDIAIRCFGEYSFRIEDPILFYTNVCGNVTGAYMRAAIEGQLKTELMTALQPAFAKISALGIRYSALPGHTAELADALNEILSAKWRELRGISIVSFGVSSVTANDEDEKMIKELQRNAAFRNPQMAAAHLVSAQAEAMQSAAANKGAGPAMAFMGMNMAGNAGGVNAQDLYAMGQQQPAGWTCACGHTGNTGKFCAECGKGTVAGWTCACGAVSKGKFCSECGAPKPAGLPQYKCDKCGWEPEDPTKPPKFCPECSDPFDDGDVKK